MGVEIQPIRATERSMVNSNAIEVEKIISPYKLNASILEDIGLNSPILT
jgi:hypothetical protein